MTRAREETDSRSDRWVAVNTHPCKERVAMENLARQGFGVYCPMIDRRRIVAGRKIDVPRPLFPSYVFVQVEPELRHWRPILSTLGVRALVRCGEELSFVADGFVESLKDREVDGKIVRPESPYRVGEQVRLEVGVFEGIVATIIAMDERERLVVLMNLLGQSVKVRTGLRGVSAV